MNLDQPTYDLIYNAKSDPDAYEHVLNQNFTKSTVESNIGQICVRLEELKSIFKSYGFNVEFMPDKADYCLVILESNYTLLLLISFDLKYTYRPVKLTVKAKSTNFKIKSSLLNRALIAKALKKVTPAINTVFEDYLVSPIEAPDEVRWVKKSYPSVSQVALSDKASLCDRSFVLTDSGLGLLLTFGIQLNNSTYYNTYILRNGCLGTLVHNKADYRQVPSLSGCYRRPIKDPDTTKYSVALKYLQAIDNNDFKLAEKLKINYLLVLGKPLTLSEAYEITYYFRQASPSASNVD